MPTNSQTRPENAISQRGLHVPYQSKVTRTSEYLATKPLHAFYTHDDIWNASDRVGPQEPPVPGNFDIDLGGLFQVQSIILWNFGSQDSAIGAFTLFASVNDSYEPQSELGEFFPDNSRAGGGTTVTTTAQFFPFSPVIARYLRLHITANNGDPANVVFGEIAADVLPLVGDYDFNGSVNYSDLDEWQSAFGSVGTSSLVDGNYDGVVDAADYTIWRDAFDSAPGLIPAPEPSAALLGLLGVAPLLSRRVR